MSETKLTVDYCETEAARSAAAAEDNERIGNPSVAEHLREEAQVYTLAARALRLEAWLENGAPDGTHVEIDAALSILRGEAT